MDLSPACDHASNDRCDCDNVVDTLERASESYRLTDWEATFARDMVPLLNAGQPLPPAQTAKVHDLVEDIWNRDAFEEAMARIIEGWPSLASSW
jgi:hypothetical protein